MTIKSSHFESYNEDTYFDIRTSCGRIIFKLVEPISVGLPERKLEYICNALEDVDTLEDADWAVYHRTGINVETVEESEYEKLVSWDMHYQSHYANMV